MQVSPQKPEPVQKMEEEKEKPKEPEYFASQTHSLADDFTPIKSLTTLNPDWIIRARITKKG